MGATGGTGATGGSPSPGCALNVAASGELPAPVVPTGILTGPAIAATDSGFVIAYRDQDPSSNTLRAIIYYVSDSGAASAPTAFDLLGCANKKPSDGVGATFANGSGLIATSLPNCDSKGAGAVFLPFDDQGLVSNAAGPQNPLATDLTVGRISSVAVGTGAGDFEFVYRTVVAQPAAPGPAVERAVLQGSQFKAGVSIVRPFGDGDFPYGLVATSGEVRALLAPVAGETQIQVDALVGDTLAPFDTFVVPGVASWAAITAWQTRVAAAIPAANGMTLVVAEMGASGVTEIAAGGVGTTPVLSGALSTLGTHLLMAQGRSGAITLHRIESAIGGLVPSPAASVEVGVPSLAAFDGEHVAMAAARKRVAVVWLTKGALQDGDATGGWALLECNE